MSTGIVYDTHCLDHDTGARHPERRERLAATWTHLEDQPWFGELVRVAARRAEREWVETIHSAQFIERAAAACRSGAPYLDVPDVSIGPESCDIALIAAGGALQLADRVVAGEIDNGFALIRPPGHHAEAGTALGFCLFNNVAITARYLQRRYGIDKVLILDWDVHHGNGTQHSFEDDPSVLYVSLHQYPYYPGTGAASETGIGRGKGATLNCPMVAGCADEDYREAFRLSILPAIEAFKPQFVLISAGFDAHRADPLAQMNLSTPFYGWMSERIVEVAAKHAEGRIVSLLEGGYDLGALPRCVARHLEVLLRADPC